MISLYNDNKRAINIIIYLALALIFLVWLQQNYLFDKPLSRIVQATITGILVGGMYALVALGIVVINKASGVFNFAHGWMMLIGGLIFYSFFTVSQVSALGAGLLATLAVLLSVTTMGSLRNPRLVIGGIVAIVVLTIGMTISIEGIQLQWLRASIGALVGSIIVGLAVERFTIRPLIGQPLFTVVLMTLAISELLHGITQITWGSVELTLPIFQNNPIRIDGRETFLGGNVIIQTQLLLAFVMALAAFIGFLLFFRFTNIGLAMRATAENQQLAQSTGLRVRVILAVTWAIAALLGMIGGVLQGGATTLSLNMPLVALRAFPAVLLGGLESIGGALIGGLVIGLVEQWGILLFPNQVGTELAPYLVLMLVLIIRPQGLFGQKIIERI